MHLDSFEDSEVLEMGHCNPSRAFQTTLTQMFLDGERWKELRRKCSPGRQRVLYLGESDVQTARVLRKYRRHRKTPRRLRQIDGGKDPTSTNSEPTEKTNAGPHEMNPLLIVDVANSSDVSEDCPSTPGEVDRTSKLNGSPANAAAVGVEEVEARSSKVWTRWRKLELRRRLTERLAASEWWRSKRRRRCGGDLAESPRDLQHTLDPKSFPDDEDFIRSILRSSPATMTSPCLVLVCKL